jgi:S-adenosylmethionine:tRNA ribosyltransferase-isomerase
MVYNQISDFDFPLPDQLISQFPTVKRTGSRLLTVDVAKQSLQSQQFPDILNWLKPGDLLVLNDTKVIPARLLGHKSSGGKLECLIERILSEHEALAHIKVSKKLHPGSEILFAEKLLATVIQRCDELYHLRFESSIPLLNLLEQYGAVPLPLYIKRQNVEADPERYQTVYARHPGAVAAPTAGLHFDETFLSLLQSQGIHLAYVTLHIGAGTFQPVRVRVLDQHKMHREFMQIPAETCEAILQCRSRGGRLFAVGTTVVRCLETLARKGFTPFCGETDLFIRPGFSFQCVDGLLTNFHLPKSTLLMLVCAFGGYDLVMKAYQKAIQEEYRFFSYGDAMLLVNPKA